MANHLSTSKLVVEYGGNPHASDSNGCTPVVLAIALGMPEIYFLGREMKLVE